VTHAEFEAFLRDQLRIHRPDFTPEEAREIAEVTARSVPDSDSARRAFLESYRSAVEEQAG
jgi:hypothetical protein